MFEILDPKRAQRLVSVFIKDYDNIVKPRIETYNERDDILGLKPIALPTVNPV